MLYPTKEALLSLTKIYKIDRSLKIKIRKNILVCREDEKKQYDIYDYPEFATAFQLFFSLFTI